ncbi:hypothetical protein F4859DRAFT_528691 [Xylaria cf. heliscus]|nr:hypothetical protein F4859DRAFT_528691 [Xylaria cf. heliscus]
MEVRTQRQEHIAESLTRNGVQVLRPNQAGYIARQGSYWCNIAREITPALIPSPTSAEQVSIVIKTLVEAGETFAIRSGGHTQYAGANNIEGGVTIDLGQLKKVEYNAATETVDLGPGGLWPDVYKALAKYERVVSGGRDGNVGVGGLVLGGGYTFFTAKRGFACDDVVAYEIVLADGSIVTATAAENGDLFRVLKGGSNNFGIVTNIRMNAFKCEKVWGGLNFFAKETAPDAIEALIDFTKACHNEEDSHLIFFFTYLVSPSPLNATHPIEWDITVDGVERAPAYEKFLNLAPFRDTTKLTTVASLVCEYDIAPSGFYNTFFTISVKNNAQIVTKASELHDELVGDLRAFIPDGNFYTQFLLQPLKPHYGQKSASRGGNIMGIENQPVDGLLLVLVVMVSTREQEVFARSKTEAWAEKLTVFASTFENGILPWTYMNYADGSQRVLQSYGADNIKKMKDAAAKYDPHGVFQKLCPGGFKLANIKE